MKKVLCIFALAVALSGCQNKNKEEYNLLTDQISPYWISRITIADIGDRIDVSYIDCQVIELTREVIIRCFITLESEPAQISYSTRGVFNIRAKDENSRQSMIRRAANSIGDPLRGANKCVKSNDSKAKKVNCLNQLLERGIIGSQIQYK